MSHEPEHYTKESEGKVGSISTVEEARSERVLLVPWHPVSDLDDLDGMLAIGECGIESVIITQIQFLDG